MKLILIILALAAVGGWYVYNEAKKNEHVQSAVEQAHTVAGKAQDIKETALDAEHRVQRAGEVIQEAAEKTKKALKK